MAKILSGIASGLTIAALFRTSFEAFDIFQTIQNQDSDFRKLRLRLNIEKCRLYDWGESMGLVDIMEIDQEPSHYGLRFPHVARDILEDLLQLFQSAERVKDKYSCRQTATLHSSSDQDPYRLFSTPARTSATFANVPLDTARTTHIKRNIEWVVFDRKRFSVLVEEIKSHIDRLVEVTAPLVVSYGVDKTAEINVKNIRNTEALAIVAEICSRDNSDIGMLLARTPAHALRRCPTRSDSSSGDITSSKVSKWSRYAGAKL